MKAVKSINNNVVLCVGKNGNEIIARGKGIGFHDFPYELDVRFIERTYYDVDEKYISMINDIPEEILDISTLIIDKASNTIDCPFSANIIFTLADHINFSIERTKKNINIKLPITQDIKHLFEKEYAIGKYGLNLIKKKLKIWLPDEEATYIALHIINAESQYEAKENINEDIIIDIIDIIEKEYEISINKNDFNYSRFVTHMHYLFKRGRSKHLLKTMNEQLYEATKEEFPKNYSCVEKVTDYLKKKMNLNLTNEEKLYLMLHINRLCSREECYQY